MDGCGENIWGSFSVIKAHCAVVPGLVAEVHSGYGEIAEPQRIAGIEDRGFGLSQPVCISGTRLLLGLIGCDCRRAASLSSIPGSTLSPCYLMAHAISSWAIVTCFALAGDVALHR